MTHPSSRSDVQFHVLLVEDNPGDIRLIKEAFAAVEQDLSFRVIEHGDVAVTKLTEQSLDPTPDLVLLDLNLPGTDGEEILETLRDDPDMGTLPVIILTGSDATEDVKRCYEAQANAYLTKPTGPTELTALAETVERFWFEHARLPPAQP